ncbi:MAG: hypothetical protein Q8P44_08755 [Dehalococcoidia bacterium]|nr:hypothetical protein [Dehalococcoidia bacterium]
MPGLENSLARAEEEAARTVKAAQVVLQAARKLLKAAHDGRLRDLGAALELMEKTQETLRQQTNASRGAWVFDEESYLGSRAYIEELIELARSSGLDLYERDDRLYSYPVLVRILPKERAVRIDKQVERRLRPSILVAHLKALQKKPPRFAPEAFLKALFAAWERLVKEKPRQGYFATVPLIDVYQVLTLLPGQSKEYSRQEFARDIYLLDRSGHLQLAGGWRASFPASTGTKFGPKKVLSVVKEDGSLKEYYGIAFSGE